MNLTPYAEEILNKFNKFRENRKRELAVLSPAERLKRKVPEIYWEKNVYEVGPPINPADKYTDERNRCCLRYKGSFPPRCERQSAFHRLFTAEFKDKIYAGGLYNLEKDPLATHSFMCLYHCRLIQLTKKFPSEKVMVDFATQPELNSEALLWGSKPFVEPEENTEEESESDSSNSDSDEEMKEEKYCAPLNMSDFDTEDSDESDTASALSDCSSLEPIPAALLLLLKTVSSGYSPEFVKNTIEKPSIVKVVQQRVLFYDEKRDARIEVSESDFARILQANDDLERQEREELAVVRAYMYNEDADDEAEEDVEDEEEEPPEKEVVDDDDDCEEDEDVRAALDVLVEDLVENSPLLQAEDDTELWRQEALDTSNADAARAREENVRELARRRRRKAFLRFGRPEDVVKTSPVPISHMSAASLRRYRQAFNIPTKSSATKSSMQEGLRKHFELLPVDAFNDFPAFVSVARRGENNVE
ncbi:unnamed protein product [Caenorhabditis auriculariae]|uniref:Histone deacetylase complex subunit SAP30 Sin3 binding domain-containing protein n=1 Tax=Caenorhabditis auriculariae TaxID=2777116 RepID=A0A8S1GZG1_9PELO|nr:unnamed protein product [Caenorhabditis auriculariae]